MCSFCVFLYFFVCVLKDTVHIFKQNGINVNILLDQRTFLILQSQEFGSGLSGGSGSGSFMRWQSRHYAVMYRVCFQDSALPGYLEEASVPCQLLAEGLIFSLQGPLHRAV